MIAAQGRPPFEMRCGHRATCCECVARLQQGCCPICRAEIFPGGGATAADPTPGLTADAVAAAMQEGEEEEDEEGEEEVRGSLQGSDADSDADDNEGDIEGDGPGTRVKYKME